MAGVEIDALIKMLARLPGMGPRSARRAAIHLLQHKESLMQPLASAIATAADAIRTCSQCGNLDTSDPCGVCASHKRDRSTICVVEQISDLWALERTNSYKGLYHVLGGTLSALDGIGPEDLNIQPLVTHAQGDQVTEIIIALNATVDGQTTAHYLMDRLEGCNVDITRLAHGVPVGGELDYLDDGTLTTALKSRRAF